MKSLLLFPTGSAAGKNNVRTFSQVFARNSLYQEVSMACENRKREIEQVIR